MARAVNRSHWGLVSSVAWRNMPGRAGERDGVQAAGLSADPLPGPSGGVPGDSRSQTIAGRAPGTASFPSQTLRRDARRAPAGEAGILAGVLEATACDPSKPKPTRQTT
jgi:hypothetical protein